MARPFTCQQQLENVRFLQMLAETGNARLAAREVRRANATMHERRKNHAGFAQSWDAAIAAAHARFHLGGGRRGPEAALRNAASAGAAVPQDEPKKKVDPGLRRDDGRGLRTRGGPFDGRPRQARSAQDKRRGLRTLGGEPVVVRTRSGRLQLRLAHPGKLTKTCEQAFLSALSATANIRLSAAAAGASARAFYRRREEDPAFAREMRLALREGYERLDAAALMAALPESHENSRWRHNEPPPIPPMSANQALQLLFLHEKSVRQSWEQPHRRRRRGETDETHRVRLAAMWRAEKAREAQEAAIRRAAHYEDEGSWRFPDEAPPLPLPPLHLVTGWSRADPDKAPHDAGVALFGGWRMGALRSGTSKGAGARRE